MSPTAAAVAPPAASARSALRGRPAASPSPLDVTLSRIQRWVQLRQLARDKWHVEAKASAGLSLERTLAVLQLKRVEAGSGDAWAGAASCVLLYSVLLCNYYWHAFMLVVSTWLVGSVIVYLVFRMLGSACTLENVVVANAYSLAPLIVLEPVVSMTAQPLPGLSSAVKACAVVWGSRAAGLSLVAEKHEGKMLLHVLPLILFFVFLVSLQTEASLAG